MNIYKYIQTAAFLDLLIVNLKPVINYGKNMSWYFFCSIFFAMNLLLGLNMRLNSRKLFYLVSKYYCICKCTGSRISEINQAWEYIWLQSPWSLSMHRYNGVRGIQLFEEITNIMQLCHKDNWASSFCNSRWSEKFNVEDQYSWGRKEHFSLGWWTHSRRNCQYKAKSWVKFDSFEDQSFVDVFSLNFYLHGLLSLSPLVTLSLPLDEIR